MIEDQAEELLLNFIKRCLEKKQSIIAREKQKANEEVKELRNTIIKLQQFEKEHIEQLRGIYEFSKYGCALFKTYLLTPINEINNIIAYTKCQDNLCKNTLPDEEAWLFYSSIDSVLLPYHFIEKELGLSHATAKKYLENLKKKNLIECKRVMGGIEYKLT